MDVLVTGSSGFIGSALVEALAQTGHRPIRAVRTDRVPSGVDAIAWDPEAGKIDAGALEGIGGVVHLAGAGIGDKRWTDERKRLIVDSRTKPTRLLAETLGALQRPPPVLVSGSAIGYYGSRADEPRDEDAPPGADFVADVCVQWEAAARPAVDAGIRLVTIRTGLVLGRGGGLLGRLVTPFRLGAGGRLGDGTQWMSWISIEDEVDAILHALRTPELRGPTNLTAPHPVTNAEFTRTLAGVLHRPAVLPTPLLPLKVLYGEELVTHVLLASQHVLSPRLTASRFSFEHPTLESALRAQVRRDDT
jgi:uncharacterized protein (TIGR01777 family)